MKPEFDPKKLAGLARLEISTAELASLGRDLETILRYVSLLETAPVASLPSASSGGEKRDSFRDDEVAPLEAPREILLPSAFRTPGGHLRVKKIFNA